MKLSFLADLILYKLFTVIVHGSASTQHHIKLITTVANVKVETKTKLTYPEFIPKECKSKCLDLPLCLSYDANEKLLVCEIHFTTGRVERAEGWTHGTKTMIQVT